MFGLNFKHALLSDVYTPHHWLEIVIEGNDAEKPVTEIPGRLFWAVDTKIFYKDTGSGWVELWRAGAGVTTHDELEGVTSSQHHVKKISGVVFNLGLASVGSKQAQALIPGNLTISVVKIYADVAPTGAALVVDVNKNGVTIFTTQANRPQIASGGHADDSGTPNVVNLAAGDRISVDVDQVGSTIPGGNDLLVVIVCP